MRRLRSSLRDDRGIGMVEIVTALVLLGIIIAGTLPFLINSIALSHQTATVGQANRVVATLLDDAKQQLQSGSCVAGVTTPSLSATDTQIFQAQRSVTCAGRLATVTVNVQAVASPTSTIATATTKMVTAS